MRTLLRCFITRMLLYIFKILVQKRHVLSFIKYFYISTHFWKYYTQCHNCFIVFLAGKRLKFFTNVKSVTYQNFVSIYNIHLYISNFQFQYLKKSLFAFFKHIFMSTTSALLFLFFLVR